MEKILLNILEYSIMFINLSLLSVYVFEIKIKHKVQIITYLFLLLFVTALSYFSDFERYDILISLISLAGFFVCIKEKREVEKAIILCLFMFILKIIIYVSLVAICDFSFDDSGNYSLIISTMSTIFIIVLYIIKKKSNSNISFLGFSHKQLILFIVGECAIVVQNAFVGYLMSFDYGWAGINIFSLIISLCNIVLVIICVGLMLSFSKNQKLKSENQISQNMLESQKNYYTMLLRKEKETKKFRHDIRNHMYCIRTLFNNRDFKKLEEYFEQINIRLDALRIDINTGNSLSNVILTDLIERFPQVEIKCIGIIDENLNISQMDFCTIFSNLLNNAFESANKCEEKFVTVVLKKMQTNLFIEIINSVVEPPFINNGKLISSKKEKNHGFGINNVKECLEKYGGNLSFNIENKTFIAQAVIPNALKF